MISRFSNSDKAGLNFSVRTKLTLLIVLLRALQTTELGSQIISALVTFNWVSQLFPAQQAIYCFFVCVVAARHMTKEDTLK